MNKSLNEISSEIWKNTISNKAEIETPVSIFLMGLPASGKSTIIKYFLEAMLDSKMSDFIHIDPDILMKTAPNYNGSRAKDFNKFGVILASKMLKNIQSHKYSYIYYGTGKNWKQYKTMINKARSLDFVTILVNVNLNKSEAKKRSKKRSRNNSINKRTVPNTVINDIHESLLKKHESGRYKDPSGTFKSIEGLTNYEILKTLVDFYVNFDNNQPFGEPPKVIDIKM
jgi:predicted kinase